MLTSGMAVLCWPMLCAVSSLPAVDSCLAIVELSPAFTTPHPPPSSLPTATTATKASPVVAVGALPSSTLLVRHIGRVGLLQDQLHPGRVGVVVEEKDSVLLFGLRLCRDELQGLHTLLVWGLAGDVGVGGVESLLVFFCIALGHALGLENLDHMVSKKDHGFGVAWTTMAESIALLARAGQWWCFDGAEETLGLEAELDIEDECKVMLPGFVEPVEVTLCKEDAGVILRGHGWHSRLFTRWDVIDDLRVGERTGIFYPDNLVQMSSATPDLLSFSFSSFLPR
ncbi:hypothetical protein BDK51DRAFT_29195 [Blyttiomyces helicus]|uniref:Secreted protein n=1 Tax=Blyttiomyces helicus TaxID=388810 RepID=A0A4P9WSI6_9FUNG|nr:hypothetical protein BDK51DRAFT_29195 [Blyttiomyces helicus]|eukprot:RKO93976.1 hypothetical protein BDK51DRAFT_29195 [Blyttiomyces helicus]